MPHMWPSGPPTEDEIWKIARRTTDIIESYITPNVYLFGSAAAYFWADIGRVPNDIDIVVCNDYGYEAEWVKQTIVNEDSRYFLVPSKQPEATHKVLYCRLPGWKSHRRRIKVDILVPPDLEIPEINEQVMFGDIPVMPLFDLLIMKTQGWRDHRNSLRADSRAKERADVTDIFALLDRAVEEDVSYQLEASKDRLPPKFMRHGLTLARSFVKINRHPEKWKRLGFPL